MLMIMMRACLIEIEAGLLQGISAACTLMKMMLL